MGNESMFVPSMWHHEVYNLSECVLSINHNWFNAFNLEMVWAHLYKEYEKVNRSPMICKLKMMKIFDDDEICADVEKLLQDECGNNFGKFVQFLSVNTSNIINKLREYRLIIDFVEDEVSDEMEFEMKCNVFSLKKVRDVISKCLDVKCFNHRHDEQM